LQIREDNLSGPEIANLVSEHIQSALKHSPRESAHVMDLEALRAPDITFWTIWQEQVLLGCGALKELDATHGEIKSMRIVKAHRGKGIASRMLQHLIAEARKRSYTRLSLETGSMDAFAPARALYARFGFEYRGPFTGYTEDPLSIFMTLAL
jgi:putative acetyltransferase